MVDGAQQLTRVGVYVHALSYAVDSRASAAQNYSVF